MGKANTQQTSYAAGEVTPLLRGRPDVARYQAGGETVENFIVRPQGPLWRRSGSQFIGRTWGGSDSIGIIVPFVFSTSEFYLLEFTESSLVTRIIIRDSDGNPEFAGSAVSVVSAAASGGSNTTLTTSGAHGLVASELVLITGSSVPSYNGLWTVGTVGSATTFNIPRPFVDTATATAREVVFATGGAPWEGADLSALSFAQSADTLFICHPNYKPRKLTRTSATSWVISEFTTVDGPYLDYDKTNTRLTVSAVDDGATLKGDAAFVSGNPFIAGDVNDWIEWQQDGIWHLARITAVDSTSEATVNMTDNTLTGLDPLLKLKIKGGNHPRTADSWVDRLQVVGKLNFQEFGIKKAQFPYSNRPGFPPDGSPDLRFKDGADLDRLSYVVVGTRLTASHGQTFERSDVGKWIRISANNWRKIESFTNHFTVVLTATTLTYKTYTYPAETVTFKQNTRSMTATVTASADTFAESDVGRHLRMSFEGSWVYAKISAYTSATEVTIQMFDNFPRSARDATNLANDGHTDLWRLGAWYGDDASGNYPGHVTFHEQRLVFAGSPAEPQTIWFSRSQDFNKMSPSDPDGAVNDDHAINVTLASNKVNGITWLQSAKVLLVGTIGGEWQGRAATSITEPITPTNIVFTEETTHGSIDNCQPVKVGSAVMFVQRSGQKLRELTYNFELDGWASRDLTIASEHILRRGTKGIKLVHQNEPHGVVWALTSDGYLAGMTYQREQEVYGWHFHSMGASGLVKSIAALPSASGTENTLFMTVQRTVDGVSRRYLEKLTVDDYPASASDKNGFFYVDSGVTETMGGTGTTWTAFSHLIGETVTVLKNGVSQGTFVVDASGAVTGLSYVLNDVLTGGLAYTSKFKSLPLQGGSPYGSADMTKKRVARLMLRVYNSINAKLGRDESNLQTRIFAGTLGAETLHTGDIELNTNLEYGSDGVFHVQCSDPYPLILLGHVAQVVANE